MRGRYIDISIATMYNIGMEKKCAGCGEIKSLTMYYKSSSAKDGRCSNCIECDRKKAKAYWERKKAEDPLYYSKRYSKSKERMSLAIKKYAKKNKEKIAEWMRVWYSKNKHKASAHHKVWKALCNGTLIRKDLCEMCGTNPTDIAHHSDYSKPLDVIWLCDSCHRLIHTGNKKLKA